MTGSPLHLSIDGLKSQAKRLRAELESNGNSIGHSQSLELLAHQHGFRDWNTLHAAIGNQPPPAPFSLGQHMRGLYLGQPFVGEIVGVQALSGAKRYRITWEFDEAVDVVTFDGMSNFRKRVTAVLDAEGKTAEKTSNGQPQMTVEMAST